jgi:hypothetical protein
MHQVRESSSRHAHAFPLVGAGVATPALLMRRNDPMAGRQPAPAVSSNVTAFGFEKCDLVPLGRRENRNVENEDASLQPRLACPLFASTAGAKTND